jgi:hypothetical protein
MLRGIWMGELVLVWEPKAQKGKEEKKKSIHSRRELFDNREPQAIKNVKNHICTKKKRKRK